jgi:hypothetical protein
MLKDRLLAKIVVDQASGCWNWTASTNLAGYGRIKANGTMRYAHRVSYELFCCDIPDGMAVCHRCDNPGCINPEHLFLGTQSDNITDMVSKGRHARGAIIAHLGIENAKAKLTEDDVVAIRGSSGLTNTKLAELFGVSKVQIGNIRNGKSWSHVVSSLPTLQTGV